MVTEIIKNLKYYTSTDLETLKSMNATSLVCSEKWDKTAHAKSYRVDTSPKCAEHIFQ